MPHAVDESCLYLFFLLSVSGWPLVAPFKNFIQLSFRVHIWLKGKSFVCLGYTVLTSNHLPSE